ncbi:MAG: hypothetical protein SGPRY_014032 [Prymnesium sp.]
MDASYCWSYAPTSRARCRGACKLPIEKGGVRLATSAPGAGDFTLTSYRCLACVTSRQLANVASKWGSVDLVPGWADMQSDDQQRIREAVEAASEPSALPVPPHLSPPQLHAFADAAKKRDFTAVQTLLAEEPGYVNAQPAGRWSALHHFAQAGNVRAVASLVRTLQRSATGLSKGADRAAKTSDGRTPLDVAHPRVAPLLGGDMSLALQHAFCDVCKDWKFDQVKLMIEAEPRLLNAQPSGRWSALHRAIAEF